MSARVTGMVFDRYPNGGGEMLLALALADHAHDDGRHIFPSVARLAAKTRQSERTVQYQLRAMQAAGWLLLVNRGTGGRQAGSMMGLPREYRINPAWINGAAIAPFTDEGDRQGLQVQADAELAGEKGADPRTQGCRTAPARVQKTDAKGAAAVAPEPIATQSNLKHPSPSGAVGEDDPAALGDEQVERALAGFGCVPAGVDRRILARFVAHRAAIRRVLSIQGWLQIREQLIHLAGQGHDPNEALRQTMAAGLALPVVPVIRSSAGATHASHPYGSAGRIEQLQQAFAAADSVDCGLRPADVFDAEFAVVD